MNVECVDNCHWGQHYDPETDTIIDIKSETPIKFTQLIKYHQVKFRELPKKRIFRKKNQPIEVDILETINEDTYPNDIETGVKPFKIYIENPCIIIISITSYQRIYFFFVIALLLPLLSPLLL
jgi:hypothetical protein